MLIPGAAPEIAETLRMVLGWAWTYVIVAELIGASSGIGHMITDSQALLATDQIIFGIIVIGLIGLVERLRVQVGQPAPVPVGAARADEAPMHRPSSRRDVSRSFASTARRHRRWRCRPPTSTSPRTTSSPSSAPRGCGKSTLLRIVAGLDRQTAGEVLLDGRRIAGPGADRGMVFQSYTLFPWLTVRDNVCFGLRERGLPRAQQLEIADAFLAKVGLRGFENHFPKQLSGGMQQRTAIARALANGPRMLLMDEPFGALDHQTRELMQELLLGIWEAERKTVLFVTHDIDEAVFMGSRVVVMSARPGRIKLDRRCRCRTRATTR